MGAFCKNCPFPHAPDPEKNVIQVTSPVVDRRAVTAHMDRKERGKAAPDGAAFLSVGFTYSNLIEIIKKFNIYIVVRNVFETLVINKKYVSNSLRHIPILRWTR